MIVIASTEPAQPKCKVAVVDMQPITPAVGGGRLRLLGLYHNLGPDYETTYVGTYDWPGERARELRLSDSLVEVDVPLSNEHFRCDAKWRNFAGGATIIDTAFPILGRLSPEFLQRAREIVAKADVVVFSHPWVYPLLAEGINRTRQLLVYDAQNVEALLRYDILGESPLGREISRGAAVAEAFLCRAADLVIGCSADDVAYFSDLYGVPNDRVAVVPNGVFANSVMPRGSASSEAAKLAVGVAGAAAIFVGSNYRPNAEAAQFIVRRLAPALPDMVFVLCGDVGDEGSLRVGLPPNVRLTGRVSVEEKLRYLHAADVAVNPMFSGSGTNIKMFDFMAAGLPVISTPIGARGICNSTRHGIVVCGPEEMPREIARMLQNRQDLLRIGSENRTWVAEEFAWEVLSPTLGDVIKRTLGLCVRGPQASNPAIAGIEEPTCCEPRFDATGPDVSPALKASPPTSHIAILSTFGIQCGIAEYTKYLAEGLLEAGARLTIIANRMEGHESAAVAGPDVLNAATVERVWHYDNATWTRSRIDSGDVVKLLNTRGARHLNVQYHRGFFPEAMLLDLVRRVLGDGMTVSLSLHNSNDATAGFLEQLARLPVTVLVHSPGEQDRLRKLGIDGIRYFPQGVRSLPRPEGTSCESDWEGLGHGPTIATFGFLRPHKGLVELLDALSILREVFPGLRLLAQTALYPSADSLKYLERVTQRIGELGLAGAVVLHHDFLAIDNAIARLSRAEAVVLPYAASDEGSSAAAAAALAARRPLITTKAGIFDELRGVAYMVEDNSPPVLAAAIGTVLSNLALRRHLEKRSIRLADARNWRHIARQLLDVAATGRADASDRETVPDRLSAHALIHT